MQKRSLLAVEQGRLSSSEAVGTGESQGCCQAEELDIFGFYVFQGRIVPNTPLGAKSPSECLCGTCPLALAKSGSAQLEISCASRG